MDNSSDSDEEFDEGDASYDYSRRKKGGRQHPGTRLEHLKPAAQEKVKLAVEFIAVYDGWEDVPKKTRGKLLVNAISRASTGTAWNCLLWTYERGEIAQWLAIRNIAHLLITLPSSNFEHVK